MIPIACLRRGLAVALLAVPVGLLVPGCGASVDPTETTTVPETPPEVLDPQPPAVDALPTETAEPAADEPEPAADETAESQAAAPPSLVDPADLTAAQDAPDQAAGDGDVELVAMDFETFRSKALVNPDVKLTVVDVWATWCGPCKENFPHLVEMHEALKDQGLNAISVAAELEPDDPATRREAETFLREQGAQFTNILLSEDPGSAFEALGINAIPAVFLYDPNGQEIGRFTLDDPNNQFDYEGVEQVVVALLKGETPPEVIGYFPAAE